MNPKSLQSFYVAVRGLVIVGVVAGGSFFIGRGFELNRQVEIAREEGGGLSDAGKGQGTYAGWILRTLAKWAVRATFDDEGPGLPPEGQRQMLSMPQTLVDSQGHVMREVGDDGYPVLNHSIGW